MGLDQEYRAMLKGPFDKVFWYSRRCKKSMLTSETMGGLRLYVVVWAPRVHVESLLPPPSFLPCSPLRRLASSRHAYQYSLIPNFERDLRGDADKSVDGSRLTGVQANSLQSNYSRRPSRGKLKNEFKYYWCVLLQLASRKQVLTLPCCLVLPQPGERLRMA